MVPPSQEGDFMVPPSQGGDFMVPPSQEGDFMVPPSQGRGTKVLHFLLDIFMTGIRPQVVS